MNGFEHLYFWIFFGMAIICVALILGTEMVISLYRKFNEDKWKLEEEERFRKDDL